MLYGPNAYKRNELLQAGRFYYCHFFLLLFFILLSFLLPLLLPVAVETKTNATATGRRHEKQLYCHWQCSLEVEVAVDQVLSSTATFAVTSV